MIEPPIQNLASIDLSICEDRAGLRRPDAVARVRLEIPGCIDSLRRRGRPISTPLRQFTVSTVRD